MTEIPQDQRPPILFDCPTRTVRLAIDNWCHASPTPLKLNGERKIMNKVSRLHS